MSDVLSTSLGKKKTSINSTATFLVFEPGLYAINFSCSSSGSSDVGLRLPCARLEGVPSPGGGQASVTTIPSTGWLSTDTASAHVLVVGGRAGALLTIYRPSDAVDMPTVEFRAVLKSTNMGPPAPASAGQPAAGGGLPDLSIVAHLQDLGDIRGVSGEWIGKTDNTSPIEGFALSVAKSIDPAQIEYQGIMGRDWLTPWFKAGSYCGSRGLQLPMLGFRVRLLDAAAKTHTLQYWGIFGDRDPVGPFTNGDLCQSDEKVMTSMKITVALAAMPAATPAAAPAEEPAAADPPPKPGRRLFPRKSK